MMRNRAVMTWITYGTMYLLAAGWLCGCAGSMKEAKKPPVETPLPSAFTTVEVTQPSTEGSLWQDTGTMNDLFANSKARRVGDIVTINIVETSTATNSAATTTGVTSSVSMGVTKFLGLENTPTTGFGANSNTIAGGTTNAFAGTGNTTRTGNLNAYITTRVIGVMPNGNLAITGTREVVVNDEKQTITLTGVIRSRDISSDNVVQSTSISDARISYNGTGIVNAEQHKGWLANFFDKYSPF